MSVSRQFLERCAADTGFRPGSLEKVVRLGEMAADIARHPLLGSALVLKGGTALNLSFGEPSRLSVDLDFNYVAQCDREKMLEDRPRIEHAMGELGRRKGYRVQRSADAFAGRKVYLSYTSVLGGDERIEVDLNFLFRLPIGEPATRDLWQPGGLDHPRLRVASLDEICIGKLLALLDRAAVRDAWDAVRLPALTSGRLSEPSFRSRLIAYSAILDHPVDKYTRERLSERITQRTVGEQLAPMLAGTRAMPADDLVQQAWEVVGAFTTLGPAEREYVDAIHRGELRPDQLFPDSPAEAAQIERHPAIQWKLFNVRGQLAPLSTKAKHGESTPEDGES
jgi:predicted nucleotidyltransferase component of viral defense system